MKTFDINVTIDETTYQDKFKLTIREHKKVVNTVELSTEELIFLYDEVKHAIDTNIV